MENEELTTLKNLKKKLLMRACDLVEELKKKEMSKKTIIINEPDTIRNTANMEKKIKQHEYKLVEISKKVSGIRFQNVDRKWLEGNVYQYKAFVTTKALKFYIELSLTLEGENEFEICDLKCDYINLNKCYALEIDTWVHDITKMKNFSLLISVIQRYTEQSLLRKTMIDNLKAEKYITDEPFVDKNGGILLYVHSPENTEQIYLKIEWTILLFERMWNMEHYFVINALEAGHNFARENRELLRNFCEPNLINQKLSDLWERLCHAIDLYEGRNDREIDNRIE